MGNILIIEDDINIRKLVSVNLEKRGYSVSEAGNGYQAMSMFREKTYDLVILDLVLPDMPGRGHMCLDSRPLRNPHYCPKRNEG